MLLEARAGCSLPWGALDATGTSRPNYVAREHRVPLRDRNRIVLRLSTPITPTKHIWTRAASVPMVIVCDCEISLTHAEQWQYTSNPPLPVPAGTCSPDVGFIVGNPSIADLTGIGPKISRWLKHNSAGNKMRKNIEIRMAGIFTTWLNTVLAGWRPGTSEVVASFLPLTPPYEFRGATA